MLLGKSIVTEKSDVKFDDKTAIMTLEDISNIIVHSYSDNDDLNSIVKRIHTRPGSISDGYHTFDELYHHRAILFSVICNLHPELAWKSKQHDDPNVPMYDGMFICGIETPQGQATYHYDIEPYWDLFNVKELERAPKYDGHTPEDAINRIKLLGFK